jgi:hypothetical protein
MATTASQNGVCPTFSPQQPVPPAHASLISNLPAAGRPVVCRAASELAAWN